MTMKIALDVDGTALAYTRDQQSIEWMDPLQVREATRVRDEARSWLHELNDMVPVELLYVTARGKHLHELTCAQLWTYPRGRLYLLPHETFDLEAAKDWKAEVLERDDADLMIGDRLLDEHAARRAGVRYLDQAEWLRTDPAELVEILVEDGLTPPTEVPP